MHMDWHRSEPRSVRPFFESRAAEHALDATAIRLFKDSEPSTDDAFDLDDIDFEKLELVIVPSVGDPALWMPKGLNRKDLEIVLIGRHPFLKRSYVVDRHSIEGALPTQIAIDADTLVWLGGGKNAQFTLALCLSGDRDPSPGLPFVTGHWLARKVFSLRSRSTPSLFDLRPRTDEEWVAVGYPAKSFFTVEYLGGIEAEAEEGASIATVYLHADAYNRMLSTSVGDTLQPILGAEIIFTVLRESAKDWSDLEDAPASSALATVLKQFGKSSPMTIPELKNMIQNNPGMLRARLQDQLNVVRAIN